jgi:hypothetical protein
MSQIDRHEGIQGWLGSWGDWDLGLTGILGWLGSWADWDLGLTGILGWQGSRVAQAQLQSNHVLIVFSHNKKRGTDNKITFLFLTHVYCDLAHAYCDLAYAYCDLGHAYCDLDHAYFPHKWRNFMKISMSQIYLEFFETAHEWKPHHWNPQEPRTGCT